jgi:hypothetical protein
MNIHSGRSRCGLGFGLVVALAVSNAAAGEWSWWPFSGRGGCAACGPCGGVGGAETPYGDTGCGPRYCGAIHDDCSGVDPCDTCNRWYGCNGAREQPERLAPWQLPPGRGFQTAAEVGYQGNGNGGACWECRNP